MDDTPEVRLPLFALDRKQSNMLRGIAILLVLLGHTQIVTQGGFGGVALFLILSGYGLNSSCESRGLKDYWPRRFQKVWLPYFFVGILDVFLLRAQGAGAVLCTLTGLDLGLIADKTMWYVSYIFFWYLVYYVLARLFGGLPGRKKRIFIAAGLLLACVPCILLSRVGFWHQGSGSKAYFLCFPLGVGMSVCRGFRTSRRLRTALWAAVLLGCAAYLCLPLLGVRDLTYLTAMSMAGAAIAVLQLLPVGGWPEKALLRIGEYSYPLYLVEGLFLLLWRDWVTAMPAKWMADLAFFAASAAAAVLYWNLYRGIEKRLPVRRG